MRQESGITEKRALFYPKRDLLATDTIAAPSTPAIVYLVMSGGAYVLCGFDQGKGGHEVCVSPRKESVMLGKNA